MSSGAVRLELENWAGSKVARLTIENERKLNAVGTPVMDALLAALSELEPVAGLRAVILGSAGAKAFIGGADIKEMAGLDPVSGRRFITRLHACCEALRDLAVPVIARIQGLTFGAGLEIAAACDLRLAADTASFGMPEVRLGIPSVVEAALLPMLIGWGRTRRLLLLGETVDAATAEQWGLVEKTVPVDRLDAALDAWIGMLIEAGPQAISAQKRLMRRWEDLPVRAAISAGIEAFSDAWQTEEPRRAMQSFLARQEARKRGRG